MTTENNKWPTYKDHLNKTYLEELAHKLWVTKGTRFTASQRLLTMNDLSNKSLGFLSAYMIIFSLLSVYQIQGTQLVNSNAVAFGSTALSILILVFTQMEGAEDFKMRAHALHQCALKISVLHDRIRSFKSLGKDIEDKKFDFCQNLSQEYQKILLEYPNHDSIDFDLFRIRHKQYYELGPWGVSNIWVRYYIRTKALYHVLITLPIPISIYLFFY
ncbi:MAG: SLATT domain-containing protein [Cyclobacteriaceae bacterium]|nr:SLATT domain-containing protein [Cyclobacteriaceae bacterium]